MKRTNIRYSVTRDMWCVDILPDDSIWSFMVLSPNPESPDAVPFLKELDRIFGLEGIINFSERSEL